MATTAANIKAAIEVTIRDKIPTLETGTRFRIVGDDSGDLGEQAAPGDAGERLVEVWHGGGTSGPDTGEDHYWGSTDYSVVETFRVVIQYPRREDERALDNLIRSDVHDIKCALDVSTAWATDVLHQYVSGWEPPDRGDKRAGRDVWLATLIVTVKFLEATS